MRQLGVSARPFVRVALAADGGTLASLHTDGTVRLWDVATGEVVASESPEPIPHGAFAWFLAIAPNGRSILVGGRMSGSIQIGTRSDDGPNIEFRRGDRLPMGNNAFFAADGRSVFVVRPHAVVHLDFPTGATLWRYAVDRGAHL